MSSLGRKNNTKVDYARVLTTVSIEDFLEIDTITQEDDNNDYQDNLADNRDNLLHPPEKKTEVLVSHREIVIPQRQIVEKLCDRPPECLRARPNIEYIRTFKIDCLPRQDVYNSTDVDEAFLKEVNAKLAASNTRISKTISLDNFENFVRDLELATERFEPVPLESAIAICKEKKYDSIMLENCEELYNYWRRQRKELKRPLLRRFWKVILADDNNPRAAFRPREKEKMRLRRSNKNLDANTVRKLKNLYDEMDMIRTEVKAIGLRERMKLRVTEMKYLRFLTLKNEKEDAASFKEMFDKFQIVQNDSRRLTSKIQKLLNSKKEDTAAIPLGEAILKDTIEKKAPTTAVQPTSEDLNFSSTAHVAAVILEARKHGITQKYFEEIFHQLTNSKPKPKPAIVDKPETAVKEEQKAAPLQQVPANWAPNNLQIAAAQKQPQAIGSQPTSAVGARPPLVPKPTPVRSTISILLRKRRGRLGRIRIDRVPISPKRFMTEMEGPQFNITNLMTSSNMAMMVGHTIFGTDSHMLIETKKEMDHEAVFASRNMAFSGLYEFEDSDEDIKEVTKNIKKLTGSNQKNPVLKSRKSSTLYPPGTSTLSTALGMSRATSVA